MKRGVGYIIAGIMMLLLGGCDTDTGPDLTGEIVLSSQRFLSDAYYLYGYSFQDGKIYRFPWSEEPDPDIINDGFRISYGSCSFSDLTHLRSLLKNLNSDF